MERVVILGSGPAGLTAAIYAGRANLSPVLLEGTLAGGQLTTTNEVENYPGFRHAILGPELMRDMRAQAERFGTRFTAGSATAVNVAHGPLTLTIEDEYSIETKTLIIATGAAPLMLGLANEARLIGHGVSTCATCDGFFFRDRDVVIVGGGDTAMEEALFLTRFAAQVIVIHRRDKLRASRIMQERALKHPKIRFVWNTVVEDVLGELFVTGVQLRDVSTGEMSTLRCAALFVAIGHRPNTGLFVGQLDMDPQGYVLTVGKSSTTSVPGVFAAGDVQDPRYRQAITAAGSGCMAAMDAERYLELAEH